MKQLTLYLAGPMTGLPDNNYPAFHEAAAQLRSAGYRVLNPAENPKPNYNPTWLDWMRLSLKQIAEADGMALLDGWTGSRGALLECSLAMGLGMETFSLWAWMAKGHPTI